MKSFSKALTFVLIAAMCFTGMFACSGSTWIAKDNGKEIPVSEYLFNAYNSYNYYNNYIVSTQGTNIQTLMQQNPSYIEYFDDEIYKTFETFYVIHKQFDSLSLSLSEEQKKSMADDYKQYVSSLGSRAKLSKYMQLMRIKDEATLKDYFGYQYKMDAVKEYYFGESGKDKKSEEQLKDSFSADYTRVKHILFKVEDTDENGEKLSEEELEKVDAKAKKNAEDLLAKLKTNKDDFDKYMLDEDINGDFSGSQANPDGYVVNVKDNTELSSGSTFDEAFVEGAEKLENIGDMSIVKGMYGYHLLRKYDLFEEDTDFFNVYTENQINTEYQEKIEAWIEEANLNYNASALNKYSVKNLKTLSD